VLRSVFSLLSAPTARSAFSPEALRLCLVTTDEQAAIDRIVLGAQRVALGAPADPNEEKNGPDEQKDASHQSSSASSSSSSVASSSSFVVPAALSPPAYSSAHVQSDHVVIEMSNLSGGIAAASAAGMSIKSHLIVDSNAGECLFHVSLYICFKYSICQFVWFVVRVGAIAACACRDALVAGAP
jgi:hypothetical protein